MKNYLKIILVTALCSALCLSFVSCKGKKYEGEKIVPEERTEEIDGSDSEYSKLY